MPVYLRWQLNSPVSVCTRNEAVCAGKISFLPLIRRNCLSATKFRKKQSPLTSSVELVCPQKEKQKQVCPKKSPTAVVLCSKSRSQTRLMPGLTFCYKVSLWKNNALRASLRHGVTLWFTASVPNIDALCVMPWVALVTNLLCVVTW